MEKEDMLLGMEMGKLEIEPVKLSRSVINANPFINSQEKGNGFKNNCFPKESKCTCLSQRKTKLGVYKKKPDKILKEPILKVLKNVGSSIFGSETCQKPQSNDELNIKKCDSLNLCTLVHNCNQLKISTSPNVQGVLVPAQNSYSRWWKSDLSCTAGLKEDATSVQETKETKPQSSNSGSCSQQALNPPCDITIDELASYFETLVHIPKKMSSMAEMMYI